MYYTECLEQYWFPAITQDACRGLVDSGHECIYTWPPVLPWAYGPCILLGHLYIKKKTEWKSSQRHNHCIKTKVPFINKEISVSISKFAWRKTTNATDNKMH